VGRALVRRPHELEPHDDVARTTRTVSFDARTWSWGDLPRRTRVLAPRVDTLVADGAVADGHLYEDRGGLVRVVRGWRADRRGLYVAAAAQPVRVVGDEVVALGALEHLVLHRYDADAPARRRLGSVRAGAVEASTPGRPVSAGPRSDRPEHAAASSAWPYLPAAVRKSAAQVVPLPDDWLGSIVQHRSRRRGLPLSQEIVMVRRSDVAAVVVRARRELPADAPKEVDVRTRLLAEMDWVVEQVTYRLHSPALIGPALPPERLPWT